ncbi:uncharacterized protein LOC132313141 [Cornus florida]|uniref:uncharacterized protein LOC132313141 n=1 Tax=Cornus florida TaxID=4283 RepID=UPI0028A27C2A|nr:uncharacterized protein LOC132313141 [Cornus florida]
MDISCPLDMSVSEDLNRSHDLKQLSLNRALCNYGDRGGLSWNDISDGLTEFLHIQDDHKSASSSISVPHSDKNDISNAEKKDSCEKACSTKLTFVISDKCLSKCAKFSCSCEKTSFAVSVHKEDEGDLNEITAAVLKEDGNESAKLTYSQPIPSPTTLKLVSAMKGSREKQGIPPKKLTVTWDPDVYDPPPTSVSHVPTNKKQRQRRGGKKNGKNRQKGKGKPTREDRKQVQKSGGSSKKCFKSFNNNGRLVECDETSVDFVDFDVGIPDSHCGSSFLKKSVTNMHFSVAEAM